MGSRKKNPYGMTDKMFNFCRLYLLEQPRNQTRAYKVAYKVKKDSTAQAASARLMKNPKVEAYINEQEEKIREKLEQEFVASTQSVMSEEGIIAHSDIGRLLASDGSLIPPHELPVKVRKSIASIEVIDTPTGVKDKNGLPVMQRKYKYKLWDKGRSLDRLEKVFGMQQNDLKLSVDDDLRSLLESIDGKHRGMLPSEIEDDD